MFRLDEMLQATKSRLDLRRNALIIHDHKKRNNKTVYFDDETKEILKKMLEIRTDNEPELFVRLKTGRKYNRNTYREHLNVYTRNFGFYETGGAVEFNVTHRSFRRFGTTCLMKSGMLGTYISYLRGDIVKKSKDIKEIYFDIDKNECQDEYNKHIFKFNF